MCIYKQIDGKSVSWLAASSCCQAARRCSRQFTFLAMQCNSLHASALTSISLSLDESLCAENEILTLLTLCIQGVLGLHQAKQQEMNIWNRT